MQSVLQYRRFGKHVEQQIARKKEVAATRSAHAAAVIQEHARPSAIHQHSKRDFIDTNAAQTVTSQETPESPETGYEDSSPDDLEKSFEPLRAGQPTTSSYDHRPSNARPSTEFGEEYESPTEAGAGPPSEPVDAAGTELGPGTFPTISRTTTQRTTATLGTRLGLSLSGIDVRDRTTKEGGDRARQVFVVDYEGAADPLNPHNWGKLRRFAATFNVAGIGFVVGVASSIDSGALPQAAEDFGVSEVVESLATGLFLCGFGAGALFAGPVSETVGRNPVYIATLSLYMVFIMAAALAPNIGAQLAFRFIAGFFGSTPLTCAGGSIADLWGSLERVYAFPIFANAAFTGPVMGPVMAGFIAQSSHVSWRWTEWTTLIMSGLVLASVLLFQPETYPGTLLKWKAAHLRRVTGDERFVAPIEVRAESFAHRLRRALYRPFVMTAREPIIALVALYLSVIYIILFTFLDGYDFIFGEIHELSQGLTGLCFLGIATGLCISSAFVPLVYGWAKRDLHKIREQGGTELPPEFRLWFAMLGGAPAIPISLFWMGWTSDANISIWSPLAASVLFGYGILSVFISSYAYIIDSYTTYAASALASITLIRYVAAGGMVVVGIPFYKNLGVHYTTTILGCLGALCAPMPYLFYKFGPQIRKRSKYAIDPFSAEGEGVDF